MAPPQLCNNLLHNFWVGVGPRRCDIPDDGYKGQMDRLKNNRLHLERFLTLISAVQSVKQPAALSARFEVAKVKLQVFIYQPLNRPALSEKWHKSAPKRTQRYVFATFVPVPWSRLESDAPVGIDPGVSLRVAFVYVLKQR